MVEIKKIKDEEFKKSICLEYGVVFDEKKHIIATIENGKTINCAIFAYEDEVGEIYAIDGFTGDLAMLDGLCRAILNIMDINGVKVIYLSEKYGELAEKVGFKRENNRFSLQLEGFFKCCCHK